MTSLEIRSYAGTPIRSFADWEAHAMPPERRAKHWKEGRSAFELGRIWTVSGAPAVPAEMAALLKSHAATEGLVIRRGTTELETILSFGNRGPRCHDLALVADQGDSTAIVSIEAKADESFGGTVTEELCKARKRPVTRFPDRLDWLTRSILGFPAFEDNQRTTLSPHVGNLPYQLLPAVAGTLLEAERVKATTAILVVHEFRTSLTTDAKMIVNSDALGSFLRFMLETNGVADQQFTLNRGHLFGPIPITKRVVAVSRQIPCQIPFFVGKIRTDRTT